MKTMFKIFDTITQPALTEALTTLAEQWDDVEVQYYELLENHTCHCFVKCVKEYTRIGGN